MSRRCGVGMLLVLGLTAAASRSGAFSDPVQDARNLGISMVHDIKIAVKSRYFDPQFRGLDVDALFAHAEWLDEMMDRMRRRPQYAWRYWTYEKERVVVAKFYTFMVTDELVNDVMSKVHDARAWTSAPRLRGRISARGASRT